MKHVLSLVAALMLSGTAHAHEIKAGDLEIIHAHINAPAAGATSAAGYMGITNSGAAPEHLIGIETGFAQMAQLHESKVDEAGVATMAPVDALEIPAGETVVLEPGGYHIMLMGLTQDITEGAMLPATLVFEHAGRVEIEFMVDPADAAMDHSRMDHSAMHGTTAPAMTGVDASDIEALLKAQFDKPESPLTVAPITIAGPVAIAGWAQGGIGGRAFLRKDDKGWFVELCSGAALKDSVTLQAMGLSVADADKLAADTLAAEAAISTELTALLDGFEGTVQIGRK